MSLFIFNPNPIYNIKEITLALHRATWTAEMEEQQALFRASPFKSTESHGEKAKIWLKTGQLHKKNGEPTPILLF